MKRRLFQFLSVVSLILLLMTVAAWAHSFWFSTSVGTAVVDFRNSQTGQYGKSSGLALLSTRGTLVLNWNGFSGYDQVRRTYRFKLTTGDALPMFWTRGHWWELLGFRVGRSGGDARIPIVWTQVCLPYWFIAMVWAVLPAIRAKRLVRSRREARLGMCRSCGYDLRATPERCPECGAVPQEHTLQH